METYLYREAMFSYFYLLLLLLLTTCRAIPESTIPKATWTAHILLPVSKHSLLSLFLVKMTQELRVFPGSSVVACLLALYMALHIHGLGHFQESRDIGPCDIVVLEAVLGRGIVRVLVNGLHDVVQPGIHLFASPAETQTVL